MRTSSKYYASGFESKYIKADADNHNLKLENANLRARLTELTTEHQLLVSKFAKLTDTGDMEFHVNGTVINAHSSIISVWSLPLATMLTSPMREGFSKSIEIKDEEPEIVRTMVKYFYTGSVDLKSDNALPLLRLCTLYDIVSLRDKCCDYLLGRISLDNCLDLFLISWLHEQEETLQWKLLLQANTEFITKNSDEIVRSCSDTLCSVGLLELHKIWPLLLSRSSCNLADSFLGWATQHWNVSDLPECLVHISSEVVNTLQETTTSSLYGEALTYFLDFCLKSIIQDFDTQRGKNGFLQVDSEYLALIIQDDHLKVESEHVVLDSVIMWTQVEPTREVHLPKLLERVRFPFIGASELVKIPLSSPIVGKCEVFGSLLQEALHFQMKSITTNNLYISNSRVQRRRHSKYQVPQIDAVDFVAYISYAVLHLTKNPMEGIAPVAGGKTELLDTDNTSERNEDARRLITSNKLFKNWFSLP